MTSYTIKTIYLTGHLHCVFFFWKNFSSSCAFASLLCFLRFFYFFFEALCTVLVPSASTPCARMILGLIGGSGLLKSNLSVLKELQEEYVDTAHGRVFLRVGPLGQSHTLVFIQRHDARACRTYTQPADINYPALVLALKAKVGLPAAWLY